MLNGVKQGGVLSPVLFCIYMDELINRLQKSGVGCRIGKQFYGGFGYADDIHVLCPSINGLQKMIYTCEFFGEEYDVTFNAKKTMAMCYGKDIPPYTRNIILNGTPIVWQKSAKYLGNMLSHDRGDADDICYKKGSFIGAVNKLNYVFKGCDSLTKMTLFQTYCTSWYGCQTWRLGTTDAHKMAVEWRKAVRRILGLSARTRSMLLPGLAGKTFHQQHHERVKNFIHKMLNSDNSAVNYIAKRAKFNTYGPIGQNLLYIKMNQSCDHIPPAIQSQIDVRVHQICELIRVRDGCDHIDFLNLDDIKDALAYLCEADIV